MHNTILLTGATGFIGSALRSKIGKNFSVIGTTHTTPLHKDKGSDLLHIDLGNERFEEQLPDNVDCVVHLAQSKGYRNFPEGAHDMRKVNIDATCKLLEWARESGVKQFIYASTANVYEESHEILTEMHPTKPTSFYGASKLSAELLLRQYQQFFQVDILRLFTVYGPGQSGMLIPNIIERIKSGQPIILAEKTGIYLSPIFVEDVVNIIEKLIVVPVIKQTRLMNVCGDQIITLKEIVDLLEKMVDKSAVTQESDSKAPHFAGSNEQLKGYIGSYQFLNFQLGLENVVQSENGQC